jgi:hypothetical protein
MAGAGHDGHRDHGPSSGAPGRLRDHDAANHGHVGVIDLRGAGGCVSTVAAIIGTWQALIAGSWAVAMTTTATIVGAWRASTAGDEPRTWHSVGGWRDGRLTVTRAVQAVTTITGGSVSAPQRGPPPPAGNICRSRHRSGNSRRTLQPVPIQPNSPAILFPSRRRPDLQIGNGCVHCCLAMRRHRG